jgi:threonine aldolase
MIFRYALKQRGAMLRKVRLLGLQFLTLFEYGLYFKIGQGERDGEAIREACLKKAIPSVIFHDKITVFIIRTANFGTEQKITLFILGKNRRAICASDLHGWATETAPCRN